MSSFDLAIKVNMVAVLCPERLVGRVSTVLPTKLVKSHWNPCWDCMLLIWVFTWLQHAVGYVNSEHYYGAKASVNVWSPRIGDPSEFSLSQIWVISGSFGNDLNTIEAGWQVHLNRAEK